MDMVSKVSNAIQELMAGWIADDGTVEDEDLARAAIAAMREPTDAVERAIAGSRARDDEGSYPRLADQLDYSGENKMWAVVRQAWSDGIDAALGGTDAA